MKVIVVHEDGDKWDRVYDLYREQLRAVDEGTLRHQGVRVELIRVLGDGEPWIPPKMTNEAP